MTKLNQILAIEKGAKTRSNQAIDGAYKMIQKPEPFAGIERTYKPKDDEGDKLPSESKHVQVKVSDLLKSVSAEWTNLFDITATKDFNNTVAKADVTVNGKTLVKNAPVAYLLWLEKQLTDLHTFISKLPRLDPAEEWDYSADVDAYVSKPAETTRSKKVMRNHVVAPATDKHPAQVQTYTEDEIVGYWTTRKFSGSLPAAMIRSMLDRVEEVQKAVKFAREEANTLEVADIKPGAGVFDYILG